ncbi:MAG: TonB-dependent receptor plug domain-containing protein, partial [bacterium]
MSNSQTGAFLEGAIVEVLGTGRTVLTERNGRFRISHLAPSEVTLEVSYTGLDPRQITVIVPGAGERAVDVALTSETYKMEAFQVSELREGNAMALTEQRNAMNVKNVVATDAFGHSRDGNVAELLVLLPGVVGTLVGNDIRTVMVRGMNANLGSVTLDGLKMANAESGGTNRNFEWDVISDEHIDAVEVIKAPTPDMEADSVGGTINLKTKSAFNFSGRRRISSTVGVSLDTAYNRILPNANFSYSGVHGADRKLGISFNWGYSEHNVGRIGTAITYPTVTTEPNYMQFYRVFDQENARIRSGGGLKLDYKLSNNTSLYVNSLVGFYNELTHRFSAARRFVVRTNAASVVPGYTDDRVEWRATANTTATLEVIAN